jgi:murein endopeptidase
LIIFPSRWVVVAGAAVSVVGIAWATVRPADGDAQLVNDGPASSVVLASPVVVEAAPLEAATLTSRLTRPARIDVARLEDAAFEAALKDNPESLGAVAAGRPNRGFLYNGVALPNDGVRFQLEEPENSFGTAETIAGLSAAVDEVHRLFPATKPLSVGHVSRSGGGWLRPHKSHQNGRDVDIGFYYSDDSRWYRTATAENLDVARTWALLSAMERSAGLEYVFVDRSLHEGLRRHAEAIGEPQEFVEYMFDGPMPVRGPIIRHARGHLTHLHVRFASPIAVENATRAARRVAQTGRNSGQLAQLLSQRQRVSHTKRGKARGAKHARLSSRAISANSRRGRAHTKTL